MCQFQIKITSFQRHSHENERISTQVTQKCQSRQSTLLTAAAEEDSKASLPCDLPFTPTEAMTPAALMTTFQTTQTRSRSNRFRVELECQFMHIALYMEGESLKKHSEWNQTAQWSVLLDMADSVPGSYGTIPSATHFILHLLANVVSDYRDGAEILLKTFLNCSNSQSSTDIWRSKFKSGHTKIKVEMPKVQAERKNPADTYSIISVFPGIGDCCDLKVGFSQTHAEVQLTL